ncbi:response regulator [Myxosarcina sp. GI1]|uniref:response regulator n=1 Tax=Myxosarcina sp. GI1 TaxID=1541065 RepID=UPI000560FD20|nr:response regulator [Myxosarcina sp. GI1]
MRILLIDDDEQLMEILADKLIEQHYAVDIASNGEMGWEFILLFDYDLVVLDWILPDTEGITLCQKIRTKGYEMPIILLTARDRHSDKVRGLDAGADDYVVKPFNFDELTARIRALLRREIHVASPILQWQDLSLNPKTYEVKYRQQLLLLTPKEYGLIELFMRHPQQVFSPGAIIENLWAGEDPPGEEAVRTHIKGLRHKLKAAGMAKDTITTVYGIGYRLKAIPEPTQASKGTSNYPEHIIHAWEKFKDVAFQRIAILENFAAALGEERSTTELYAEAKSVAHKLAGSLGVLGFPKGSQIAKQLENLLEKEPLEVKRVSEPLLALKLELQHQPFEEIVRETLEKNISLLIIDRDTKFRQQLVTEAKNSGMNVYTAANLIRAKEIITQESPTAVLYKIIFPDGEDLEFLEQLHQQKPQLPIAIIVKEAKLLDRLEIVRKGGSSILQNSITPSTAITSVVELIKSTGTTAKILIVDDDPQVLLSLEISLAPWGFELTTLDRPTQFWQVLEAVKPDLLVLDVEMPEISGIELCQVLRSDRRWQHLPVLFLTVHQDKKTEHQAFAIGADDYLVKPVIASELASRILNRLRRSQFNRQH